MEHDNAALDERRPVTILFADIVASTALAEKLDPEEWKEVVIGAHQHVSDAVTRYEGTIAQLLGDGVLAFFGAPKAHEDDPARAVSAGLEIQRAISEYARTLKGFVNDFQMRVGIHSGVVVVGLVGSKDHSEYLAVGDAVNLAARMQSAAQPGRVLLSDTTARLVRHAFELADLGELDVKGKSEPIRVFEVVDKRAAQSNRRGIEGVSSPLVGRTHELAQLRAAVGELEGGHGQIVFVLGEAGIGKSRLLEEAQRGLPSAAARFLEGRALSYGQALPFWMIIQLIQNDLGLADGDPEIRTRVALRRRVVQLLGTNSDEVLPYLERLLGAQVEGDTGARLKALDGETLKRQTLLAIGEYFSRIAGQQPTVLVLEDLHWADPSSLEALEHLFVFTDRVPLMLLALMRVERDHGSWRVMQGARTNYEHRYTELYLKPLSDDDQNLLVNNLLQVSDLPAGARRLILERSEGNPFYLEEIIRHLIEQGAIVAESNQWRSAGGIANVDIPDTLHGVLLARLDRLQDDVRRTLQLASVIGKTFQYRLLQAIAQAEQQLDSHLAQLQRADLVREKARRPELEYIFKHALTQEAAYDSLLIERRREFHRQVGIALESMFADRGDEYLGLLAHHFDRAGEREKAVDYLIRAGDRTRLQDAHEEAIKFYRRAIELLQELGDSRRQVRTWLKLGLIYHSNFEFDKAHVANEKAFALESKLHDDKKYVARESADSLESHRELRVMTNVGGGLDPGRAVFETQLQLVANLFAGLAELDSELNLVPHGASSWEVLDAGTRYLFHLRQDVSWTNGEYVIAADYEWAWKRALREGVPQATMLLDDVVGAREFRQTQDGNPESVGVRAMDEWTLEVRLNEPTAYFPYIMAMPIAFPVPRATIERYGSDWWKPEYIVSNGPFRLLEYDMEHSRMRLERNQNYFGEYPGNLDYVTLLGADLGSSPDEVLLTRGTQFYAGNVDLALYQVLTDPLTGQPFETIASDLLNTQVVFLNTSRPPLQDVRVRRALFYALDSKRLVEMDSRLNSIHRIASGGLIPPGMAGHSPGIGLKHDLAAARELLAQAGFPDSAGFPVLGVEPDGRAFYLPLVEELTRQWKEGLGIDVRLREQSTESIPDVILGGWIADYPDPDTFMRVWALSSMLAPVGWSDPAYSDLVRRAARTTDRARRMELYRQADHYMVVEKALVYPRAYGRRSIIAKPWVKHFEITPLGVVHYKNIVIEPH